jgi:phosphoglycolate phosphatase-like HAD superfamily hydrolase
LKPSSLRGVLFDLDGTLVDSFRPIHSSFLYALSSLGSNRTLEWKEMMALVGTSLEDSLRLLVPEESVGRAVTLFREHYNRIVLDQTVPLPGAVDLLAFLESRNIPSGVVTNKKGDAARRILSHLKLSPPIRFCLGEADGFAAKPSPDMVEEGLRRLGTGPADTLFVGDSPFDFHAARSAGVPVALLPTGTHGRDELQTLAPDLLFEDLPAFEKWWVTRHGG